jgi:type II secretory pathway component PulF
MDRETVYEILNQVDTKAAHWVREMEQLANVATMTANLAEATRNMVDLARAHNTTLEQYTQQLARSNAIRTEVLAALRTPMGLAALLILCITVMVLTGFGEQALGLAQPLIQALILYLTPAAPVGHGV